MLELHVEMDEIEPRIWRRLHVPADATLDRLHAILQIAFGWTDSHLHDFSVGAARFGVRDVEDELLCVDERAAPLGAVVSVGGTFNYRYDFGDCWDHTIRLDKVLDQDHPFVVECVGGARACPPEDSGGTNGYQSLLASLRDPEDEEHESTRTWVGTKFDPERFDMIAVNKKLGVLGRRLARELRSTRR